MKRLERIKKDLDTYRVNFNIFTSEQSLYDNCLIEDVLNKLRYSNKCYLKDDALWLKTSDYGDEKDRVLIKNDGDYTYFTPDFFNISVKISTNSVYLNAGLFPITNIVFFFSLAHNTVSCLLSVFTFNFMPSAG